MNATGVPALPPTRSCFNALVLSSPRRLAIPIAVYPGLTLTGATVRDIVTNSEAQLAAAMALHERYHTPVVLSAMDLSVEAEAFGCEVCFGDNEIPFVVGRLVTTMEQAQALPVPQPGNGRTALYLDTVRRLKKAAGGPLVLGGTIGPFSLAARLVGVGESMELTLTDPELVITLLEKCTEFLTGYVRAFREAGADGLIMAEPAAGLLSPRGMQAFSSAYIKAIAKAALSGPFTLILHNCAAKLAHLNAVLETGLRTFHFGAPMDLPSALGKVPPETVLCGNLDPAAVFVQLTPPEVKRRAGDLLKATAPHPNYVLSSGCDVPATVPLASIDAFYEALAEAA